MNGQLSLIQSQSSFFANNLQALSHIIIENAKDGVELSFMDINTVENVDAALIAAHGMSRSCLYWMREKKGWQQLGFESFEAYGEARFGFSRQHLSRLCDAHAIQTIIEPISTSKDIKESVLRVLKDVPDDVKKQIWDELKLKTDGKSEKITAKMVDEQVAAYKRENEQLQKKLLEVESDMQARFDELQDKQLALTNNNEKIISERVLAVSERYELANKNLSESLVKEQNQKAKLEKQIEALKANTTSDHSEIENAESRLAEVEKEIEAKQKQLEQFNARLESDYDDSHVNQNIITICQEFREHIALSISELAHLKNVNQTVYEKTNSEIYGTADLLEEFAKKLRIFATDYADFSMSSTTIQ